MSADVEHQWITITPSQSRNRGQAEDSSHSTLSLRRSISIHGQPVVPPAACLPIEYRTLSVHLESNKSVKNLNTNSKGSKGAVKGQPPPSLVPSR